MKIGSERAMNTSWTTGHTLDTKYTPIKIEHDTTAMKKDDVID